MDPNGRENGHLHWMELEPNVQSSAFPTSRGSILNNYVRRKKVKNWEETKQVLHARFETNGKEQMYQHLRNMGTQGNKAVQEWAQLMPSLSLRALEASGSGIKNEPRTEGTGTRAPAEEKEGTKTGLNYMRKTNFIRGLCKNLLQEVWRRKYQTFEEAIEMATAEEALEVTNWEEEVRSGFQGDPRGQTTGDLNEGLLAALDARDEVKYEETKTKWEAVEGELKKAQ